MKLKLNRYFLLYAAVFGMVFTYSMLDTNYLFWADASAEYALYYKILSTGKWLATEGLLSSSILTTFLPAKLQPFSNLSPMLFFKLYIASLVSILPVAVYRLAKTYGLGKLAIVAALFVIVQFHFARAPLFARIDISLTCWALMLICIREKVRYRYALVTVLGVLIVLSYYAVAFLAIFVLAFVVIVERQRISLAALASTSAASLLWHGIITKVAFVTAGRVVKKSLETTSEAVAQAVTPAGPAPPVAPVPPVETVPPEIINPVPFYDITIGDFWHMGISVDWSAPVEVFGFVSFWLAIAIVVLGILTHRRDILLPFVCAIPMFSVYFFPHLESSYGFIRLYFFGVIAFSPFLVYGLKRLWNYNWGIAVIVGVTVLTGYASTDTAQVFAVILALAIGGMATLQHFVTRPEAGSVARLAGADGKIVMLNK